MAGELVEVRTEIVGTIVRLPIEEGQLVAAGQIVVVLESMKMEHPIQVERSVRVLEVCVELGRGVDAGDVLLVGEEIELVSGGEPEALTPSDRASAALEELDERIELLADDARGHRLERRRSQGLRTARENVADLVDPGSFVEYGRFAYAAQRARRSEAELIAETPADGLIGGIGTVNAAEFGAERSSCVVASYDYMVLAGTQGQRNHRKKDRLFELASELSLPVVLFAEGGGGRPGDTDTAVVTGLDTEAFARFAALSGQVPLLGIAAGRCFAGNAALLGCCDVVIAVEGASIGMGGPAMIEGGGLGVVAPDEVGPVPIHRAAGSVDIVVADEAEAVSVAKALLGLFQGSTLGSEPADVDLRQVIPADRRRAFDPREVLVGIVDEGSMIELRGGDGLSMVTAFGRVGGRPMALLANDSRHLGGAIDAPAADKAARLLQIAEARGLAVLSVLDTPGFMVGPEAEATGLVRHVSRMFVAGAALSVPVIALIARRGYGLGAQAMATGSFRAPIATIAWPTGEMGGMGLEGAVRLGFRRELDAIDDDDERSSLEERLIAAAYENGRALNVAAHLEIDDVIDPATTRSVLLRLLAAAPGRIRHPRPGRFIDTA